MPQKNAQKDRQSTAVGYLRRSTEQQEQSIPDQRSAIDRYATEHGLQVIHYYIDDAITGTRTKGRKAFQDMMKAAQRHSRDFCFVIVYDIKRFGRVDNDEAGHYRSQTKGRKAFKEMMKGAIMLRKAKVSDPERC